MGNKLKIAVKMHDSDKNFDPIKLSDTSNGSSSIAAGNFALQPPF